MENPIGIGVDFDAEWTGPNNLGDYLTIVQVGAADSHYMSYAYAHKGSPSRLSAPGVPGEYEVRYIQGQSKVALVRAQVTVETVGAVLKAPESIVAGQVFQVEWQGPNNKGDYITITAKEASGAAYMSYAYTSEGSNVKLNAPELPGNYELRYILGGPKVVIGRKKIKVE